MNHLELRHREAVTTLEEQITRLKAQVQTAEHTEPTVSVYQQDIDLELEKVSYHNLGFLWSIVFFESRV